MSEKASLRRGDPKKRAEAQRALSEAGFLKAEYKTNKKKLDELEDQLQHERVKEDIATADFFNAQDELARIEEIIDSDHLPEGAQPKTRIKTRDELKVHVAQLESALAAQRRITHNFGEAVIDAERKLFQADRSLNQFIDTVEDADAVLALQKDLDKDRADRLIKLEKLRTSRWEAEEKAAVDARAAQIRELAQLASSQLSNARASHKTAVVRGEAVVEKIKAAVKKQKEDIDAHHDRRMNAVLSLKANSDLARVETQNLAEKHVKKVNAAKKQLEDEKDTMVSKGLNPYAEFRQKAFDEEADSLEKRLKRNVETNKLNLSQRMNKEETTRQREEGVLRRARAYEQVFRDEQGRHVVEDRTRDFVTGITTGGMEVLDPTGRKDPITVQPSQVTDLHDFSFGLGKSSRIPPDNMKRITENIRKQLKHDKDDLGEYRRLVKGLLPPEERDKSPSKSASKSSPRPLKDLAAVTGAAAATSDLRSQSAPSGHDIGDDANISESRRGSFDDSRATAAAAQLLAVEEERLRKEAVKARKEQETRLQELQLLANKLGPTPGVDTAAATVNLDWEQDGPEAEIARLLKMAEEENGGAIQGTDKADLSEERKYPVREQSKFEQDAFDRAKDRQRVRVEEGQPQIAGGRLFKGQSFIPKPAEIVFKDFEVGKKYKKVFTLTNVSYSFNSFKLLDLPADVTDFFTITYEKPGRMSAGVSCSIEILFAPQLNKDILVGVKYLSETGPGEIPLKCLIKRCAPKIQTSFIDFGRMVIGQRSTLPLKIKNSQALSTDFTIVRVADGDDDSGGNMSQSSRRKGMNSRGSSRAGGSRSIGGLGLAIDIDAANADLLGDDDDDYDHTQGADADPASSSQDLSARVQRVMTESLRRKQRETPYAFSIPERPPSAASLNTISCPGDDYEGFIDGYSNVSIDVLCAPLTVGPIEFKFSVFFTSVRNSSMTTDEEGNLITKEQQFVCRVYGEELPIYPEEVTMDLKCILHGRIYRKRLTLSNRAQTAVRVNFKISPQFSKYVEINPDMLFVQGMASQAVNVKFTPTVDMLNKVSFFSCMQEGFLNAALLNFPIEIQVANQELPAFFVLQSHVTPSGLDLSAKHLDYGKVYVNQQSILPLIVTNTSMLPQKVAFVRLKKEITVQPNDGFATLLPNESMIFEVAFSPMTVVDYNLDLILMTSVNDKYVIRLTGEGIETPVTFSSAVVMMRTTAPGERVVEDVFVKNNTSTKQTFEILLPHQRFSWLRISPSIVELAPGAGARLEVEYLPPADLLSLDPQTWYSDVLKDHVSELNDEAAAARRLLLGDATTTATATSATPAGDDGQISDVVDGDDVGPFTEWVEDSGWVIAKGDFGEIQWVKKGAGVIGVSDDKVVGEEEGDGGGPSGEEKQLVADALNSGGAEGGHQDVSHPETNLIEDGGGDGETKTGGAQSSSSQRHAQFETDDGSSLEIPANVPDGEWGVVANWRLPICIKPKRKLGLSTGAVPGAATGDASDLTLTPTTRKVSATSFGVTGSGAALPPPMFMSVQTVVMLPQIDADTKVVDFGQMALGTRQLLTVRISNNSYNAVELKAGGLNAVGPFQMLNPVKRLEPGEFKKLVVECVPTVPGLFVEILELKSSDEIGGHRVRITLRAQGVQPSVSLEGLAPAPAAWGSRSGIVDFNNVLVNDTAVQSFKIVNNSSFPVETNLVRSACVGLSSYSQSSELQHRTANGLPIFTFRPERVKLEPGASQKVDVFFRPDRTRFLPFREDLNLVIGDTDEVIKVGMVGRSRGRQIYVYTDRPIDEPFASGLYGGPLNGGSVDGQGLGSSLLIDDLLATSGVLEVKKAAQDAQLSAQVKLPAHPPIKLEYPDPYAPHADPSTYTDLDTDQQQQGKGAATTGGGDKSKKSTAVTGRQQTRRVIISSIKPVDNRAGNGNGTFEVVLSPAAIESKLWSVVISLAGGSPTAPGPAGVPADRGLGVAPGGVVNVDITCTLPPPRGVGGLSVGSWQTFPAEVIVRGGWVSPGDADETRLPLLLKAFVSL